MNVKDLTLMHGKSAVTRWNVALWTMSFFDNAFLSGADVAEHQLGVAQRTVIREGNKGFCLGLGGGRGSFLLSLIHGGFLSC